MEKNNSLNFLHRCQELKLDSSLEGTFFLINLNQVSEEELFQASNLLDNSTLQKAKKKKQVKDQIKLIVTHATLKVLLSKKLKVPADSIKAIYKEFGKPYLKDFPLHFSLSYGEKYSALAFHPKYSIGIDIEAVRELNDLMQTANLFMHPEEIKCLKLSKDFLSYFFGVWTLKEAFLKAQEIPFDDLPKHDLSIQLDQNKTFSKNNFKRTFYINQGIVPEHSLGVCIYKYSRIKS